MVVNNTLRGSIMLSGLSLGDHLSKTSYGSHGSGSGGGSGGYKGHTLESVTDTEPTVDIEEEDENDDHSFTPGESFDESFAAVSLDDDDDETTSLPSLQGAPPASPLTTANHVHVHGHSAASHMANINMMTNSSTRSSRSTRSNGSTRSSGSRSTRQAAQRDNNNLNGSSSQLMMAPKSPYGLRRSHTHSHVTSSHYGNNAHGHSNNTHGGIPRERERIHRERDRIPREPRGIDRTHSSPTPAMPSPYQRGAGGMRDTSDRTHHHQDRKPSRGMRRTRSLNREENQEGSIRVLRTPSESSSNAAPTNLQRQASLQFSGHSSIRIASGHNMHSSFMFQDNDLNDLLDAGGDSFAGGPSGAGGRPGTQETTSVVAKGMDRIGENPFEMDDMQALDLSVVSHEATGAAGSGKRQRRHSSSKPKEDAQRMAALLRFGQSFFGGAGAGAGAAGGDNQQELNRQSSHTHIGADDVLGNVDDLPLHWTRNAENIPGAQQQQQPRKEKNYLPSLKPKHRPRSLSTIQEAIHDSTFAQNVNFLQDTAEAMTTGFASDVNKQIEERKSTWQRNMAIIGTWIKDTPL